MNAFKIILGKTSPSGPSHKSLCLLLLTPLCPINTEILHKSILIRPSLSLQGGRTKHKHNTEG